jgi:signal transduction histidine kinase
MNPAIIPLTPGSDTTLLPGRLRLLARLAVSALAVMAFSLITAALVYRTGRPWIFDELDQAALARLGLTTGFFNAWFVSQEMLLPIVWGVLGIVIFWRKPDDRAAVFFAINLLTYGISGPPTFNALVRDHALWRWPYEIVSYVGLFTSFVSFYVFPDGRFVPRWTRWLILLCAAWVLVAKNVLGAWQPDIPLAALGDSTLLLIGAITQLYRYRVSTVLQRQQIKWVVFALILNVIGQVAANLYFELIVAPSEDWAFLTVLYNLIGLPLLIVLPQILIALTIAFSILRYRLWDIDLVINRALVYGALTTLIAGLYVLTVTGLGALFRSDNILISLAATLVAALLFQPARDRLQRGVNRLMYGERDEPYAVLSRLSRRLETTLSPNAILPTIVETVAQALKLPHAEIAIREGDEMKPVAVYDKQTPPLLLSDPLRLPLSYQAEIIGELRLASRAPGETFTPAEQRLLEDIATQAGVAAQALRLTADLQRSRERLVTAREEERRRLRRDLHDGLGPTLAAQTLKIGSARALFQRDPAAADSLMGELENDIDTAMSDIRRLVYDLRPPALDDLGLVAALRAHAAQYESSGLCLTLTAPDQLPPLPAAVEVACYRIAQEALTNVVRHAKAQNCTIRLTLNSDLKLEIEDDGRGLPKDRKTGVGLSSMRERAEELGGTCVIEGRAEGGTRVIAKLPLAR